MKTVLNMGSMKTERKKRKTRIVMNMSKVKKLMKTKVRIDFEYARNGDKY